MGLNIIVLVKQVPDTQNITGEAMKEDGTVNRAALPAIFNPDDLHALEAALEIKDTIHDTHVSVLTMGPPSAAQVLKDSLYRGADFTAIISDRKFAGADTLATSYALKCAIEKIGTYDLIFCGRQAIDGDTAQVGPQTAEKLGINQITNVSNIESVDPKKRELVAKRSIEGGFELVKAPFPLLLTVNDEEYVPRPPSVIKMMTYKNAGIGDGNSKYDDSYLESSGMQKSKDIINLWDISSIKAVVKSCGLAGSPTKVKKIESVVLKSEDIKMIENTHEAITDMVHELITDHTIG